MFTRAKEALTIYLLIKSTTLIKPIRSRLRGDAKILQMSHKIARGVRGIALGIKCVEVYQEEEEDLSGPA